MDLLWLVLGLIALAVTGAVLPWFYTRRKGRAILESEKPRANLNNIKTTLANIKNALEPFSSPKAYVPERVRRPLLAEVIELVERSLPSIAKTVQRTRDRAMREDFETLMRDASKLRQVLTQHNDEYVRAEIAKHSKLLVEKLGLDAVQRRATVLDDERNLIIGGAGSGKTRALIARIRYLLERGLSPTAILGVTFTKKATEEMEDRLKRMDIPVSSRQEEGVTISTLHAIGMRVVQATMLGPIGVAEENWTVSLVAAALRDARNARDQRLAGLYFNAILHFYRNEDECAPAIGGDLTYRTLRGEHVRSVGERIVADFLFTHHVPYKYEAKASWAQVGAGRTAYHPDFTLLETDASIEYWGINRNGEVPQGWAISSNQYEQRRAWTRDQFLLQGKTLIEFFDYERTEGTLAAALESRLAGVGGVLRPMTLKELEKAFGDRKYIGSVIEELLAQFIANARSLRLTREEILRRLNPAIPRVYHFGLLGIAVLERYERELAAQGRVDFSDMLHRAADTLESGTNPVPQFEHILVDEFQDMSAAMARFLKALLAVNNARLFAVGDDWQAIYGFGGGDVDHIVNFESHFGLASTAMLDVNYRSPALIVEAGAALIAHNPKQIPKQIVVYSQERGEAYVHEVPDDDFEIVNATVRLVQEERQRAKSDDILVLSRTNHLLEIVKEAFKHNGIPVVNTDRSVPGVLVLSAHKSKGLEANVVIVVNASDHLFGFPSKVENPDVLEPVRMSPGNDQAEERRLFYVAITRAMKRVHLVLRRGLPSPYIAEIEGTASQSKAANLSLARPGVRFGDTFYVEQVYPLSDRQSNAGIYQSGLLTTNTGRFSFTSWAHIDLEEGGTYLLNGVLSDRPYRDQQQVTLDAATRVKRQTAPPTVIENGRTRELRPRPPSPYRPHLLRSPS